MSKPTKILIVEDEMIIGANISLHLSILGYEVTGMLPRGEQVIVHVRENKPDILLLDIALKGQLDGIDTAKMVQKEFDQPIIYLTSNIDEATFNRAKSTKPYAFISKPYKKLDLQRAIELTINRIAEEKVKEAGVLPPTDSKTEKERSYVLGDRIFIRDREKMIKIIIADIYYLQADRNYCKIYTKNKKFVLSQPLKNIEEKLPSAHFLRIHRSYIVNLFHIETVSEGYLTIFSQMLPISKLLREDLLKRLKMI